MKVNFLMMNLTKKPTFYIIKLRKRGVFMNSISVYTVREVASIIKVSDKTVYGLIHDQQLKCIWVRGQIRITSEQLDAYLQGGSNNEKRNER